MFSPDDEVQRECSITFKYGNGDTFDAIGLIDVYKRDTVFELKFVSELTHEHFLQCASYVAATGAKRGILWNTKDDKMYEITIPNKSKFLNAVARTRTKGEFNARWIDPDRPKKGKYKVAKPA